MATLKSVKSLCHMVLRGAPLSPRTRYRPPSSSPLPSFILVFSPVHLNRSPSPFTELFHRNYPPSPVHRIRLAAPFTPTVLRLRSPSESYRDAFAAPDADVNETGGVGRELIAVKIPCNASCRHLQNHRAPSACRDSTTVATRN